MPRHVRRPVGEEVVVVVEGDPEGMHQVAVVVDAPHLEAAAAVVVVAVVEGPGWTGLVHGVVAGVLAVVAVEHVP